MTTILERPLLQVRRRRALVAFAAASAAAGGAGVLVGASVHNAPRVAIIAVPAPQVTVELPVQPTPTVSINVPPPSATPAPEPASESPPSSRAPEPSPESPPHSRAPKVWSQCAEGDRADGDVCAWDDGFPAIARDGSLIAVKDVADDPGRGFPGLTIRFVDARSGKLARSIVVLDPNEYIDDSAESEAAIDKLKAKIAARAAKVQRMLDEGAYRTMTALGGGDVDRATDELPHTHDSLYAEIAGGATRVIDPATNTVLWQHDFSLPAPKPWDDDDTCGDASLRSLELWWDPATRVVLASLGYTTGGCLCPSGTFEQVARIPD